MFHRAARICLEIVAGLVVIAVAGAGLAAWRLAQGPISLSALTPYIDDALENQLPGLDLTIGDTVIAWQGWDQGFGIRLRDVEARTPSGLRVVSLPEASVDLSIRALLAGRIVPLAAETDGLRLSLEREPGGGIRLRGQSPTTGSDRVEVAGDAPDAFAWLGGGPGGHRLQRISMRDAAIELADPALGAVWKLERVNLVVTAAADGARLVSDLEVTRKGETLRLAVDAHARRESRTLQAGIAFSDLRTALFADLHPAGAPLNSLDAPASGKVDLTLDSALRVTALSAALRFGEGRFVDLSVLPAPLAFRSVTARLAYDHAADRAVIETFEADLGGPVLQASATVEALSVAPRVSGQASARRVPVDSLGPLWPPDAARGARKWIVANLSEGIADEANFEFDLHAAAPDWSGLDLDRLRGEVRCSGLTVNYVTPMPKVVGAGGHLVMDHRRVDITVASGGIGALAVQEGRIAITGLDGPDQAIDIALTVKGPVREMIELIDSPPLGYAKKIGHEPSAFAGEATTRLKLGFPLIDRLKVDSVRVSGEVDAVGFGMRNAALDQDVRNGDVKARFDERALHMAGRIDFGRSRLDVDFMQAFLASAPEQQRVKASGTLPVGELAAFGIDTKPYLEGPLPATVEIVARRGGRSDISVEAGLDEAELAIPELGWKKPAGVPGSGRIEVVLQRDKLIELRIPRVVAGDLDAQARVVLAADGRRVARIELTRLRAGRTDIGGTVTRTPSGWNADVSGKSLDAATLLHERRGGPPDAARPRITIKLRADEVFTTAEYSLTDVHVEADRRTRWDTLRVRAQGVARDGVRAPFVLELTTGADGMQTLNGFSTNAGALLRGSGITDNFVGGELRLSGATDPARADRALRVQLNIREYRLIEVPAIARFLQIALLTGLADAARGQGIGFSRLDLRGWLTEDTLEVEESDASGPALGFTARGTLNFADDTVDLQGVIIPANAVNSLLGRIPVVGEVLFGPGLFAANYTMRGPQRNPEVSINTLSAIAPGVLRQIFRGGTAAPSAPPSGVPPYPGGPGSQSQ